jgi:hypothetical protein
MSAKTTSEPASSNTTTEHPGSPSRKWYKLVLGMPLIVVALYVLVMRATPDNAFFQGETPGVYWLYLHFFDIMNSLFWAMPIVCILVLICVRFRVVLRLPLDWFDYIMTIISVMFLALTILLSFTHVDFFDRVVHLDTKKTEFHIYHLGKGHGSRYLVLECDRVGFMCQRLYESDKQGYLYLMNGSLEYDPTTDEISLIDSGNVLFTHQVNP